MGNLNKVILIGRCGGDLELRHTTNGTPVATVNLATNETWTGKKGEKQERTEWHQVVVWGKTAEFVAEHAGKGSQVFVEGSLRTRSYETEDGQTRRITEIVARNIQLLDPRPKETSQAADEEKTPSDDGESMKLELEDVPF